MIVIAIVALAALGRYSLMADDARILRLEIISHHFMTGAANARAQFLVTNLGVNKGEAGAFGLEGKMFYFSAQGWPVSVSGPVADNYRPNDDDCYQLWMLLLQNPAAVTQGEKVESRDEYRAFAQANNCRYEFTDGTAYFDYYPLDGRLVFTRAPL